MADPPPLTYKDAGVDIDAGNALVERIKPLAARTLRPEVLSDLGGFGALVALPTKYREPILVSGTDGVGTKLKLLQQTGRHAVAGIDLVAMCVNDVVVQGAEPLFFLDYFAAGSLDPEVATAVIGGVASGCADAGCALIGGETAEMPDMYAPQEYDLAGFCVGVVEKSQIISGSDIGCGDVIFGMASSGPHANGFSLIRKLIQVHKVNLDSDLQGTPLADRLLQPTRIYVRTALRLMEKVSVHGFAHITGGGLKENLVRVVPKQLAVEVDTQAWPPPPVFDWIQRSGRIEALEMLTTFNCGIGFCVFLDPAEVPAAAAVCADHGIAGWPIGTVTPGGGQRIRFSAP